MAVLGGGITAHDRELALTLVQGCRGRKPIWFEGGLDAHARVLRDKVLDEGSGGLPVLGARLRDGDGEGEQAEEQVDRDAPPRALSAAEKRTAVAQHQSTAKAAATKETPAHTVRSMV